MQKIGNLITEDLIEGLKITVHDLQVEIELLEDIIKCLLEDALDYERTIWDSELRDASEDSVLTIERVNCEGCAEGGLRIYLDHDY